MQEDDLGAVGTLLDLLGDEAHPRFFEPGDLRWKVVHLEAQVVQSGPAFVQVLGQGGLLVEGSHELDAALADLEELDLGTGCLDVLAAAGVDAQGIGEAGGRLIQVVHGNGDVMDTLDHAAKIRSGLGSVQKVAEPSRAKKGSSMEEVFEVRISRYADSESFEKVVGLLAKLYPDRSRDELASGLAMTPVLLTHEASRRAAETLETVLGELGARVRIKAVSAAEESSFAGLEVEKDFLQKIRNRERTPVGRPRPSGGSQEDPSLNTQKPPWERG